MVLSIRHVSFVHVLSFRHMSFGHYVGCSGVICPLVMVFSVRYLAFGNGVVCSLFSGWSWCCVSFVVKPRLCLFIICRSIIVLSEYSRSSYVVLAWCCIVCSSFVVWSWCCRYVICRFDMVLFVRPLSFCHVVVYSSFLNVWQMCCLFDIYAVVMVAFWSVFKAAMWLWDRQIATKVL